MPLPLILPQAATVYPHLFKRVSLLLSRDLGVMLCPFGGLRGGLIHPPPLIPPPAGGQGRLSMRT